MKDQEVVETQHDDGSRNALNEFMRERGKNTNAVVQHFVEHTQYWKARVFLELLWEYERKHDASEAQ